MQTRSEMETELLARLEAADNSTLYPSARLTAVIKNAHLWATGLFPFSELQRAKKRTVTALQTDFDYYNYPLEFRTDSLAEILYVNDLPYDRKAMKDFLEYRRKNPSRTDKRIFADFARQFWIFPTPSVGDIIKAYGQIQAADLSTPRSTTIFSVSNDQGNEAIVKKGYADLIKAKNPKLAADEEKSASGMLAIIYQRQKDRQQTEQRLDHPMFDVPDFVGGARVSTPGNFSVALQDP